MTSAGYLPPGYHLCSGCGKVITFRFAICANCEETYGKKATEWPRWLRYLWNQEQRERRTGTRDNKFVDPTVQITAWEDTGPEYFIDDLPWACDVRDMLLENLIFWEAVDQLPEGYRETVLVFYLQCDTQQQAADILGVTRGNVSVRLTRANELINDYIFS